MKNYIVVNVEVERDVYELALFEIENDLGVSFNVFPKIGNRFELFNYVKSEGGKVYYFEEIIRINRQASQLGRTVSLDDAVPIDLSYL